MFVRRKPNKTGTVSIQVITKSRGRYEVSCSFGTGRTESELNRLEEKARQYIREKEGLIGDLFADEDEFKLEEFISTLSNHQLQVIGPELIFGRLYDSMGYGEIASTLFRHLVITRLFHPGSKMKTIDYLYRYQGISYSTDKIYRFLDNLCWQKPATDKTMMEAYLDKVKIPYDHIKPYTPKHNGKVERSHRKDNERFYRHRRFYSLEDARLQIRKYNQEYNNFPMQPLNWKSPNEYLRDYLNKFK